MWPKPRPASTAYQPLSSTSEQSNPSLWPTASIPTSQLLHSRSTLPPSHLLGGVAAIPPSLLLGGSTPIAEHLLLRPNLAEHAPQPQKRDPLLEDENEHENDDFEHLDYLEPDDEMPLTSRKRLAQRLPRLSLRSAVVGATVLVLGVCAVAVFFAIGGPEHPLGRDDYRK